MHILAMKRIMEKLILQTSVIIIIKPVPIFIPLMSAFSISWRTNNDNYLTRGKGVEWAKGEEKNGISAF